MANQFLTESERANQLVTERPKHWRYLLTIELLRCKLAPINKQFDDLQRGQMFRRSYRVSEKEAIGWLLCKVRDLNNLIPCLQRTICNELVAAWGANSDLCDPFAVHAAVENICGSARQLVAWEEEIRFALLPGQIEKIQETLRGTTVQFLGEVNRLVDQLEAPFHQKAFAGKFKVRILFRDPKNMARLSKQLSLLAKDVEQNPRNWIGWS